MMLHEITAQAGARRRRKRVGRGESSGHGRTCGRGNKGYQSRSGGGSRPLSEGGQMPFFRRMPKRGFNNANFRTEYQIVNVGALDQRFQDGQTVDAAALAAGRLIDDARGLLRILGGGVLSKRLTVEAHAFSPRARAAIEQAGGTVRLIERKSAAEKAAAKRRTARSRAAGAPT